MIESLAPSLLIAAPGMDDMHFTRSVVAVTNTSSDGTIGFTLNRPTKHKFREIARELEFDTFSPGMDEAIIFDGGPVSQERGWLLYNDKDAQVIDSTVIEVTQDVRLGITVDFLRQFCAEEHDLRFKFLMGNARWWPGQLEAELTAGVWLPLEFDSEFIFSTPSTNLWHAAISRLGLNPMNVMVSTVGEA